MENTVTDQVLYDWQCIDETDLNKYYQRLQSERVNMLENNIASSTDCDDNNCSIDEWIALVKERNRVFHKIFVNNNIRILNDQLINLYSTIRYLFKTTHYNDRLPNVLKVNLLLTLNELCKYLEDNDFNVDNIFTEYCKVQLTNESISSCASSTDDDNVILAPGDDYSSFVIQPENNNVFTKGIINTLPSLRLESNKSKDRNRCGFNEFARVLTGHGDRFNSNDSSAFSDTEYQSAVSDDIRSVASTAGSSHYVKSSTKKQQLLTERLINSTLGGGGIITNKESIINHGYNIMDNNKVMIEDQVSDSSVD